MLCVGDDASDELMFGHLHSKMGKTAPQLMTATVGRKPSEANCYLNDHNEVVELLETFCTHGNQAPVAPPPQKPGGGIGMRRAPSANHGMNASYNNLSALG